MVAAGLANQPPREWSETGLFRARDRPRAPRRGVSGKRPAAAAALPPASSAEALQMLDSRVEQKENLARGKLLRRESAFRPTAKLAPREVRLRITMPARPARTASFRSDTTD